METDKKTFDYLWKSLNDEKQDVQILAGYEGEDAKEKIVCILVGTKVEHAKDGNSEKTIITIRAT